MGAPANTRARVCVPSASGRLLVDARPAAAEAGGGYACVEVGSGARTVAAAGGAVVV